MALWLVNKMVKQGHTVAFLSSELTVQQRISVLDRFREREEKLLVSTNVLSRGIDIGQVTIVINFDLPVTVTREPDYHTYLHRIGRTGRFGKKGIAINLVSDSSDHYVLKQLEEHFGKPIECLKNDNTDDMDKFEEEA